MVKNPPTNMDDVRDVGLIPGLGRSPGGGHGNPLQYSCLENLMDRGSWQTTVHRVANSQTKLKQLSMCAVWQQTLLTTSLSFPTQKLHAQLRDHLLCDKLLTSFLAFHQVYFSFCTSVTAYIHFYYAYDIIYDNVCLQDLPCQTVHCSRPEHSVAFISECSVSK